MAKLMASRDYSSKKNKGENIVGYRLSLTKTGVAKAGFELDDELEIEYKKEKIIVTKKK